MEDEEVGSTESQTPPTVFSLSMGTTVVGVVTSRYGGAWTVRAPLALSTSTGEVILVRMNVFNFMAPITLYERFVVATYEADAITTRTYYEYLDLLKKRDGDSGDTSIVQGSVFSTLDTRTGKTTPIDVGPVEKPPVGTPLGSKVISIDELRKTTKRITD